MVQKYDPMKATMDLEVKMGNAQQEGFNSHIDDNKFSDTSSSNYALSSPIF